MLSPWNVYLTSTDYDLSDIRKDLSEFLDSKDLNVLAFERPDFPVQPQVHSHDACLIPLQQADIVILLIDKRYGGLYLGQGPESITEMEYKKATQLKITLIPCIRKKAWDDRHNSFNNIKELQKLGISDPREKILPQYVEKWKVLDFIDKVRKADKDNFVIIFEDSTDLISQLEGRLKGISLWILQKLVKAQIQQTKDIKTTTAMSFSLGDVIRKKYYMESPYKMISGKTRNKTPSSILKTLRKNDLCALILGEPGSGKSTLLGKVFLEHANNAITQNSINLPFFISLRAKGAYNFDYESYIQKCFENYMQKVPYPLLSLENIKPTFYMDGLDEVGDGQTIFDPKRFCESTMFQKQFILSCRSRYAHEYINQTLVGSRFSVEIELLPWNEEIINRYIKTFCRIKKRPELVTELMSAFTSGEGMEEIARNPLLITLYLCIVEEAQMKVPLDIRNKQSLFSKILKIWAIRELGRTRNSTSINQQDKEVLLQAWRIAAWQIYRSRFSADPPIKLGDLLSKVKIIYPEATIICEKEAFVGLFDIQKYTDEVKGLIHEQLLEELVAELLCKGIRSGRYPFPDSLGVAVRWEINQLIQSVWAESEKSFLDDTLNNLVDTFHTSLNDDSPKGILHRNQAAYYIGRIDIPEVDSELLKADENEKNIFVKLSIGFGLIRRQDFKFEESFVQKLREDTEWDACNRGYHLHYYHDWYTSNLQPPYKDPGIVSWDRTLRALLFHIESSDLKHISIRRIELFTLRRFIETRKIKGPLSQVIMERIDRSINATTQINYPSVPADYIEELHIERDKLKAAWKAAR